MPHAPYDTLIIGAGMSGLAAGIRLAQYDQRVLVLEKHYLWGGLNSFYKRAGRRFDVGLHALTNYVPKGTRGTPLAKLLRQLRLRHDDLALGEQSFSEVRFPSESLRFSNDFELLQSEVERAFPAQRDAFAELVRRVEAYDAFRPEPGGPGARSVLAELFDEPLLVEMLLAPILYYGSAREDDVEWYQFAILFQSLYQEGFARPEGGIKPLLDLLVARYEELGGELRMRTPVAELLHEDGRCRGVRLESGEELLAERVLSSAGWGETMRMAGAALAEQYVSEADQGALSFVESIHVLDSEPRELGFDATIVFYCEDERFVYRRPETLVDPRSGVICCPNNYAARESLPEGIVRTTSLARPDAWRALDSEAYQAEKLRAADAVLDVVTPHLGFDPRPREVFRDTFTPLTVERFTSKRDGAVYGSPTKRLDGTTPLEDLYIIGTDQGLLGVTGAMLSGISMANRYALQTNAT